ncbi:SCO family protein [Flavobacterium urocaniciphilum]|uniref:Protein SCO1/2 n=1 Tax=Flavobacterium urocaniciphilum TaxID=1299341 RepID=A0A1H9DL72_9FLAO|nr:SCO family protein [Flavobacterium urocaniciphilum]SEQ14161.1 protein SCO1/2 [Flavobacterium urocaniciphilum]
MKKNSYIGISFIVLLFGIWTVKELTERFKDSGLEKLGKVPTFELTDQNGKKVTNKDYQGKVFVVEFFFANCATICPKMNQNMLQLQEANYGNLDFGIASITIDPENDTAAALKEHATKLGVKHPNWHFLTGNYEYIMNLANKGFNIYAGKDEKAQGGFEHSGLFALIDKEGNIRCRKDNFGNPILYYDGLEQPGIDAIKEDIKLLLEE